MGEMWKSKLSFRLCLRKVAFDEITWHCKHYTGRGVMKFCGVSGKTGLDKTFYYDIIPDFAVKSEPS